MQGDSSTFTLVVTMSIKPEKEDEWVAAAGEFVKTVERTEPGTLLYVLTKHPEREHTYVWVERYADVAAAEAHRNTQHMKAIQPLLQASIDGPPEILRLSQVHPQ